MHELYNVEKEFNEAGFSPLTIEKVSWSSYGIQVSNLYEDDKHQTRGSQITKIVSMDMFANGQEAMEGALALYEKNVEMLDMLHENAYNTLLEKLGIVDTTVGIDLTKTFGKSSLTARVAHLQRSYNGDDMVRVGMIGDTRDITVGTENMSAMRAGLLWKLNLASDLDLYVNGNYIHGSTVNGADGNVSLRLQF
jgi:hypothetical protein